jgi:hypothetical protein
MMFLPYTLHILQVERQQVALASLNATLTASMLGAGGGSSGNLSADAAEWGVGNPSGQSPHTSPGRSRSHGGLNSDLRRSLGYDSSLAASQGGAGWPLEDVEEGVEEDTGEGPIPGLDTAVVERYGSRLGRGVPLSMTASASSTAGAGKSAGRARPMTAHPGTGARPGSAFVSGAAAGARALSAASTAGGGGSGSTQYGMLLNSSGPTMHTSPAKRRPTSAAGVGMRAFINGSLKSWRET